MDQIENRKPLTKKFKDITGRRFGRVTVLKFLGFRGKYSIWKIECDCGEIETWWRTGFNRKSQCKKCSGVGGAGRHPLYVTWILTINKRACKRWEKSFWRFAEDIPNRPSTNHVLSRIDDSKIFKPGNVKWITKSESNHKRVNARLLTASNGESMTAMQWCERLGITRCRLYQRLDKMPERVAVSYARHGTSPERDAWLFSVHQRGRIQQCVDNLRFHLRGIPDSDVLIDRLAKAVENHVITLSQKTKRNPE